MIKPIQQAVITALFIAGIFSSAGARMQYDTLGMKTYKKLCKSCHGDAYKGAGMLTNREWKKYFAKDAKMLIARHAKVSETKELFESSFFQNRSRHLERFLSNNGSDSGVVPGCDGNYCR